MATDFDRLLAVLNSARIQQSQPALYQTIKGLIDYAKQNQTETNGAVAENTDNINAVSLATFLTATNQAALLLNSRQLLAGIGVSFDDTVANQRTINSTGFHWTFNNSITNTQFKALPSTYIELVPTPGAGKVLVPHWAYIQINAGTPYTNVDTSSLSGISIAYGDWDEDCFTFTFGFTGASHRQYFQPAQAVPNAAELLFPSYPPKAYVFMKEDAPLKLIAWNDPGDYTGGDNANSFRVGVAYSILDIQTGEFS
jgi:hypothetical protein